MTTIAFFTSGAFWFVEGILAVLAVIGLKVWMEDRNTPMPAWKWPLVGLWMILCGFTIAFIGTSVGESERVAAQKGGIIFSVLCVITGAGLWRVLQIGRAKSPAGDQADGCATAEQARAEPAGDEET
ncbi:hypothetical protein HQ560_15400 [bacterium]|nr:hypothetical protein [bacterium]